MLTLAALHPAWWVGIIIAGIIGFIIFIFIMQYLGLWFQALLSNARVGIFDLIGMRFRKVRPQVIVYSRIQAVKAGLQISTNQLETHYLAGGNVRSVIMALIAANRAKIDLPWDTACAIDLAGRDILDAVQTSVNPKVIDCPNPAAGRPTIDAVAQDGIQLKARARVTVRANIARLVGGATEETIIARVGEGIVTTIGSAVTHKAVLENPDNISKVVLSKGLDSGTAFEILSIDIADIDVGENIGAKLQADQAEADKRRFQAEAEKRRAMAVAQEQEFVAEVQKNRALVVLAEAEVPKAMADAFRSGNMGIMDYYRMKNIQADTSMRDADRRGRRGRQGLSPFEVMDPRPRRKVGPFYCSEGGNGYSDPLASSRGTMGGPGARVAREPGQTLIGAALSDRHPVPPVSCPPFHATGFFHVITQGAARTGGFRGFSSIRWTFFDPKTFKTLFHRDNIRTDAYFERIICNRVSENVHRTDRELTLIKKGNTMKSVTSIVFAARPGSGSDRQPGRGFELLKLLGQYHHRVARP